MIAAPSGAGKTSLVRELIKMLDDIKISISYTTRPQRPGEINGEDYHFIDEAKFQEMIDENVFIEFATVFGHLYGTSKEWVSRQLQKGVDVILEIDWQGARQIRQSYHSSVSIYIIPPSMSTLKARLLQRNQDNLAVIDARMKAAKEEIRHYHEFDYVVCNDDFDDALAQLKSIINTHRLRTVVQQEKLAPVLAKLLETQ